MPVQPPPALGLIFGNAAAHVGRPFSGQGFGRVHGGGDFEKMKDPLPELRGKAKRVKQVVRPGQGIAAGASGDFYPISDHLLDVLPYRYPGDACLFGDPGAGQGLALGVKKPVKDRLSGIFFLVNHFFIFLITFLSK